MSTMTIGGYNANSEGRAQQRAGVRVTSGSVTNKPRHIPKGHDAILKRLQDDKSKVSVELVNGFEYIGVIEGRDKFTISVLPEGRPFPRVIYKSAIASFGRI